MADVSNTDSLDFAGGFEDDPGVSLTKERWIQAQRDLVTTTLDYNLQALSSLVREGSIDLAPAFQRRDRWDRQRQSRLIESFLMNVPLPPIFLNEDDYGTYSIIDGKQRLTAIASYMADDYPLAGLEIFAEAEGLRFSELDRGLRMVLETRASLRAIIILRMSDPEIKYQVFQRLNTGGVRLNAQEIRNVAFTGPLNSALLEWSTDPLFAGLLGVSRPEDQQKSALWKQMRDVELVLRYFTLKGRWTDFSGSLVGEMNAFAGSQKNATKARLRAMKKDFTETVAKVNAAFGDAAFRRYRPQGDYGQQVLASVYDAQMLALNGVSLAEARGNGKALRAGMEKLFETPAFLESIGSQTNTPRSVKTRVQLALDMVDRAAGRV